MKKKTIGSNLCRLSRVFLVGVVFVPMNHVDRMPSYGHWVALLGNCQILGIFNHKPTFFTAFNLLWRSPYNNSIYLPHTFSFSPLTVKKKHPPIKNLATENFQCISLLNQSKCWTRRCFRTIKNYKLNVSSVSEEVCTNVAYHSRRLRVIFCIELT